jgi:DNA repair photolyase
LKTPTAGFWDIPATIARNNFVNKSLSSFALNIAVGCSHACRFCYVPGVSTGRGAIATKLKGLGVEDPDEDWGSYVFLRRWDEDAFVKSLEAAERTPVSDLNADGNRAVMLCTTTDPYMVIRHQDAKERFRLNEERKRTVRRALELIRDRSTLNVRILTRSPLAQEDFDLMRSFGPRLLFGMSLPTLNEKLAKLYEPSAPGTRARFRILVKAKETGLRVFVAMAPTFPECDRVDLEFTLSFIRDLNAVTVFHEPINIRADNVERIAKHASEMGLKAKTEVFQTRDTWAKYAMGQFRDVEEIARNLGIYDRLHLWPDAALKKHAPEWWLSEWWGRVSEWPKGAARAC